MPLKKSLELFCMFLTKIDRSIVKWNFSQFPIPYVTIKILLLKNIF